jgi:hypothetical protein
MKAFWDKLFTENFRQDRVPGHWHGMTYPGYLSKLGGWLAECLDRMYVRPTAGSGSFIHVLRGLMSGWRTTSVINNAMNFCYLSILQEALQPILGLSFLLFARVNGDDSDMVVATLFAGLYFLRAMSLSELDVQAGKQLISQECSEFLRIWIDRDGVQGNLNRSVASFVCSDLQAPVVDAGPEYVAGTSSAIHTLHRRGADHDLLHLLTDTILLRHAYIKTWNPLGEPVVVQLTNPSMLYVPKDQGGWNCVKYGDLGRHIPQSSRPWLNVRAPWTLDAAPHFGAQKMLSKIWGSFTEAGLDTTPLERLYRDIIDVSAHGVDTLEHKPEDDYARWLKSKHIMWQNVLPAASMWHTRHHYLKM